MISRGKGFCYFCGGICILCISIRRCIISGIGLCYIICIIGIGRLNGSSCSLYWIGFGEGKSSLSICVFWICDGKGVVVCLKAVNIFFVLFIVLGVGKGLFIVFDWGSEGIIGCFGVGNRLSYG